MHSVKLYLLGPPRLELNGREVNLGLKKGIALLALLAVTRRHYSRDALAAMLWPESDQSTSRADLRRTLYRVNKAVGEAELLKATPETVSLNPQAHLELDTEQYHRLIADCLGSSRESASLTNNCVLRLHEAVELYKSDFMAGFSLGDCPEFDDWQFFQSESLQRSLSEALDRLVAVHKANGNYAEAIAYARRRLITNPFEETVHSELMELYASSGQHGAALRQYDHCVQMLRQELGREPKQETTAIYEAIRSGARTREKPRSFALPKTHYVMSGDVHIAYQMVGGGAMDLIVVSGFVSHVEQIWREPRLAGFLQKLSSFCRVILFDKRGVGLSDRIGYAPTIEDTASDMLAVMDAVGSRSAVLLGISEGGPAVMLFAATRPERTLGLILYGAPAKGSQSPDYPWALSREQFELWRDKLVNGWGGPAGIEYFAPSAANNDELQEWWAELLRLGSSPGSVKAILDVLRDIDVRGILPTIRTPTLILHRTSDRVVRIGAARFIALQIQGAHFVELTGGDHLIWVGETDLLLDTVRDFIAGLDR